MGNLVTVGFLSTVFDEDFALKHARRAVAEHLFEHLTALATLCIVGDEHRIIVQEIAAIANAGTSNMRNRVIACEFNHGFVAGQNAVHCQGERFERGLCSEAGKDASHSTAFVVTTLGADMVEGRFISDFDLKHLVETCSRWAVFQQSDRCALFDLYQIVEDRVRGHVLVQVGQVDRLAHLFGHTDHDPIGREGGVQRGQRTLNRCLTTGFQNTVEVFGPVNIAAHRIRETFDFHTVERQIVGRLGIEHAINENDFQTVEIVENRYLVVLKYRSLGRVNRRQRGRIGVAPIFVTFDRQTHRRNTRECGLTRLGRPTCPIRQGQGR